MFRVVAVGSITRAISVALAVAFLAASSSVNAQGAVTLLDLQSSCLVGSVPNAERLTVTWTGACPNNAANGLGDLIGFSNGRLRYILRGEFKAGQLLRQDRLRDCTAAGTAANCADDVPVSLVRLHEQAAARSAAPVPAPTTAATPVYATGASAPPAATPAGASTPVATSAAATTPSAREIRAPDAVYRGNFTQDAATGTVSGEGRIEFFDGRSFEGALRNGRKLGVGTYVWADGQRYVGEWANDVQQGRGVWSSRAGDRYEGAHVAGRREGLGSMTYASGMRYEGAWKADQESGRGKLQFVNGDTYEGDFVAGARTGNGTYQQKNGSTYTGQWLRGLREGNGVEEWPTGQRYEGAWRGNKKEGLGQMRYSDGGTFDGDWRNDQATGQGDIVFASGDNYTGQVRDGQPHGLGIFRWGSGDRFEGEFAAGKPTAKGEMTFMFTAVGTPATSGSEPSTTTAPPTPLATGSAADATPAAPSRANLCAAAFNAANTAVALRRFMDSFPDDECGRHTLAKQKIAASVERDRLAARATDEKAALAKTLVGAVVAFQQEFPFCVSGTGSSCQRVTYVFDVKAKIREIDVQKRTARVQISDATSLGNLKRAPAQLFNEGRAAATVDYKTRAVGVIQSKSLDEIGLAF